MSNDSQDKGDKPREQAPRTPQQQQQSGSQQGRDQGGSQQDRDSQQRQGG